MAFVDHKAAEYACKKWHYTKKIPVFKLNNVGIWENDKFIGVIIYGLGASAQVHKQFNIKQQEICELVRIALNNHNNYVSKYISYSIKMLKKKNPNLKIIISFADPSQDHNGGIYQATNWIYTGQSSKTREYYYNGDYRHVTDVYKRINKKDIKKLKYIEKDGKYRYLMPLTKEMRKKILPLSKPYPKKCGCGVNSSTSDFRSEGDDASANQPLQSIKVGR